MSFRSSRKRRGRSWGQRLVLGVNAVMIGAALTLAWMLHFTYEQVANVDRVELGGTLSVAPSTKPGERVLNILLVGYDSAAGLDPNDPIQTDRNGERLGDVTIILHVDERAGTASLLSIPRDLWIPIEGYGDRKLNYAFGIGGAKLLIETIETELDIPIHHYMSVDFAGFQGLIEAVDYVEVYFEQPARDFNWQEGVTQTGFEMLGSGCQPLDPPTALSYVRSRWYQVQNDDGEWVESWPPQDIGRIQRQQDFMYQLIKRAIRAGARNPFTLADLVEVSLDQITIDQELTPQLLLDLGETYRSFDPNELDTYSYPSDIDRVNSLSVLLPLRDQADAILEIFRGAEVGAPSTVFLTMVADPALVARSASLEQALQNQGFVFANTAVNGRPGGLTLQHGVDGLGAAQIVEAALREAGVTEPIAFELIEGDPVYHVANQGRSVVLVVGSAAETDAVHLEDITTTTPQQGQPTTSSSLAQGTTSTTAPEPAAGTTPITAPEVDPSVVLGIDEEPELAVSCG